MTIEKARKILGESAKTLTDKEVEEIIACFNALIEVGIRQFERKHRNNPKGTSQK
jgi:ABC-type transporter MlaC component